MISTITYHLHVEERKGKHFLAVRGRHGDKPLAWDRLALALVEGSEKKWVQCLVQQGSLLPPAQVEEVLKGLALTRRLHWEERKVFFDPFTRLALSYVAERIGDEVRLRGKWRGGGQEGFLDEGVGLCALDPPCFVTRETLYFFDGKVDRSWYQKVYPQPAKVPVEIFSMWQKEWAIDPEGAPACQRIMEDIPSTIDPLPLLKLTDRTGAFANLVMDYGSLGQVDFHAMMTKSTSLFRHPQGEKGWEKDLLETDFLLKSVDSSHYYCPLDKVAKSLTFLLEIGWKIFDYQGRQVVRQGNSSLSVEALSEHLIIKGSFHYGSHQVNLTRVMGAFTRQERFVSLDDYTVGLVDISTDDGGWQGLAAESIVADQIIMKKERGGVLGALWNQMQIEEGSPLEAWVAALDGVPKVETKPPTADFQGSLFPYQQKGVDWLCWLKQLGFSGLLADEMGLGKTVQVLAFLSHQQQEKPTLIVAPTSLLFNWRREIENFLPGRSIYLHHGPGRGAVPTNSIILTSYALLRLDREQLQSIEYELVILDEGQWIKNADSQIAQAAYGLRATMRLVLSGTPLENRVDDLWSLFRFLVPGLLGEKATFKANMGLIDQDRRHLVQVKNKIRPFLLRRKKLEVGIELPEKLVQTVWVDMSETQRILYDKWIKSHRSGMLKKQVEGSGSAERMEILEAILRLRQLCGHPWLVDRSIEGECLALSGKMERLMADLEEVVTDGSKVLIYSQFTQMLQLIQAELQKRKFCHVYLDGSTKDREGVVRRFQEDPAVSIFLISLKAGGVGLNLTAADYVFLIDPWWNEAVENQAIDRAHRVGRSDRVIARRYITVLSIEEKLMKLKEHKRSLSEGLLEGGDELPALSLEDLKALLT